MIEFPRAVSFDFYYLKKNLVFYFLNFAIAIMFCDTYN